MYLSLGSNLGEREKNLERALEALAQEGIAVEARSSVYETEPQDVTDQPWFLNMVVRCRTHFFPIQLLAVLKRIEKELGRREGTRRGPRVADLDILLFNGTVMDSPELTIPHQKMTERRFVLEPLIEINPGAQHPATHKSFASYLRQLAGQTVRKAALG